MLLLFATALFAVASNVILLAPRLNRPERRRTVGGLVAHIGAGLMLLGVVCLVMFSQHAERVVLVKNVPAQALGYTVTYLGMSTQPYDREKNAIRVRVEKNGVVYEADPRYYFAPWENKDTLFANPPDIQRNLWGDLYVAYSGGPQGLDAKGQINSNNGFVLTQKQSVTSGEYTFTFLGLDLDERARKTLAEHQGQPQAMADLPEVTFKALVGVKYRGQVMIAEPQMRLDQKNGAMYSQPVEIPGGWDTTKVMLNFIPPAPEAMNSPAAFDKITFQTMNAPDPTEAVMLDITTKPMIWLVWLGAALYTAGGLIAYRRRALDLGILGEETDPADATPATP